MTEQMQASEQSSERTGAKTLKIALRAIVFLALALALFVYLNLATALKGSEQNKGTFDAFYDLPENSVDVMYFGASTTSRYFINTKAFVDYGIASYSFGMQNSPVFFVEELMREVQRTQDPDLYIVELRGVAKDVSGVSDENARFTSDMINLLSPNRIEMAKRMQTYCESDDSEADEDEDETDESSGDGTLDASEDSIANDPFAILDYLIPIAKYHNRAIAGELTQNDFMLTTPYNVKMGFYTSSRTATIAPQDDPSFTDEVGEMYDSSREVLDDLLDYCDTLDKEVLFVIAPFPASEKKSEVLNAITQHVQERGYDMLNCNSYEICDEIGIDWTTDFYNNHHVNYMGAEKYTDFFAKYLKEHYDLSDHRDDPAYQAWSEGHLDYLEFVSTHELEIGTGDEEDV